jgi:hypothetical protein
LENLTFVKRCAVCPDPVIYRGPALLSNATTFCDETCARIWDAITPGEWIDANELMPGGRFHDRPDIWAP